MLTQKITLGFCLLILAQTHVQADYLDDIGLTTLRARDASLDGSGVTVAQIEASTSSSSDIWQTDPDDTGLASTLFTYYDSDSPYASGGSTYDSSKESFHANRVGALFFGLETGTQGSNGIAPGVDAIEMYYASYHPSYIVFTKVSTQAKIINCSFVFGEQYDIYDIAYDTYTAEYNVLFCNGIYTDANNDDDVASLITSPASSYNCIAVGVEDDANLTSLDDDRSKPDIVAPAPGAYAYYTSYTTPVVSGAATLLYQSALREDAGSGTADDATDPRTLKALLLNSATKTSDWSHTSTHPLDRINGAGVLEINNAQLLLAAGQYSETEDDVATDSGESHLPSSDITTELSSNMGWNFSTLTNAFTITNDSSSGGRPELSQSVTITYTDSTDHYFFDCDAADASTFNLTATLVWNRNANETSINNLDLFLYKEDGTLVASSVSTVDNVEHLYELDLEPGRYVLQVYKPEDGRTSTSETYALAFNFEAGTPVAASDASATTVSSSAIQLDWSDNADNETGFRIERRISDGSYSTLTTVDADVITYTDSSCAAGTTYDYQIIAYNDNGDADAAEVSATTYTVQEAWRLSYFGSTSDSDDGANDADPDLDGLSNLLEFATGSDPLSSSSNPVSTELLASDQQFSFTWRSNSGYDYSIGYSEDLTADFTYYSSSDIESGLSSELELISTVTIDSEFETLTYGVTDSVTSNKVFIRLQIE
jgi:hypothetical protein